jgi:hypothetical protein
MKLTTLIISAVILLVLALSQIALADSHDHDEQQPSFSVHSLIKPLGIATLSCITATFIAGLFRKKLRTKFLKIHLPLAVLSLILGLTHALLVLILWGF